MAIGIYLGRSSPTENIDPSYEAVRTFMNEFISEFRTLNCIELTGVDLATAEGQAEFIEKERGVDCTKYVGEAARIVADLVDGRYL